MIPLRDSVKSSVYPYVTVALIVVNVTVFLLQIFFDIATLNQLFTLFGVIPTLFTRLTLIELFFNPFPILSLLTAIFLHGSWLHLLSNMLYLWIFGDNVEDRLGHGGFLVFYLITGVVGSLSHILANPASTVPTIGASGAIAGVLGAYLVFYPRAKVQAIIPLVFIYTITRIRAIYFLFIWFVLQILNGITMMSSSGTDVAWWAHIGGFAAGALLALYITAKSFNLQKA